MTNFEPPLIFADRGVPAARRLPSVGAVRTAVLLALLVAYGVGFAVLYPLVQTSAVQSAAEGNDPALCVGS